MQDYSVTQWEWPIHLFIIYETGRINNNKIIIMLQILFYHIFHYNNCNAVN